MVCHSVSYVEGFEGTVLLDWTYERRALFLLGVFFHPRVRPGDCTKLEDTARVEKLHVGAESRVLKHALPDTLFGTPFQNCTTRMYIYPCN